MIEDFNKSQKDLRKDLADFNDKMANHSISTISLSVPFVGFLSSKAVEGLIDFQERFMIMPLYCFLFVGWFCLATTLIFGVSYRKRVADYDSFIAKVLLLNYLGSKSSEELDKIKKDGDKLFKPIAESNRCLLIFFVTGIYFILFFVAGSTMQLLRIN